MSEPILEIREVHTYYGHVHALKGISLSIEPGEIVALIGANGAGKTTTLRTVSGLLRPRDGDILINGKSLKEIPAHEIVFMGVSHAPEGRKIFSTLSVNENLNMGAYTLSNKARIEEHREHVFTLFPRLKERRNQLAGTLSGGEQQMLAIGRALMSDPRYCCSTNRRSASPRFWCAPSSTSSARSTGPAQPFSWWSKTPVPRSSWRTRAMCWRPAVSCCPGRPRRCWQMNG
jgi:ABC-type branched-subunit amino acid transport system ATPase component